MVWGTKGIFYGERGTTPNEVVYTPVIAPDGHPVIVDVPRAPHSSELRLLERSGTEARTVMKSNTAHKLTAMDWCRNGRTVLVGALEGGATRHLYLLEVDTGAIRGVPINDGGDSEGDAPSRTGLCSADVPT